MTIQRRYPPRAGTWTGRLVVLLLGLSLVLMHHTVATDQAAGHAAAHTASATGADHGRAAGPVDAHGPSEQRHEGDHASMLLHLCLAVLAAGAVLLVAAAVDGGRIASPRRDDVPARAVAAVPVARPPPVTVRLARLQVLRL